MGAGDVRTEHREQGGGWDRSGRHFLVLGFEEVKPKKRRKRPSIQFSHSVVSDSLRPHEPQHARPPCPSPTPRVHPNPCPSSQ